VKFQCTYAYQILYEDLKESYQYSESDLCAEFSAHSCELFKCQESSVSSSDS